MRRAVLCVSLAFALLSVRAGAQSLSMTEADALNRLSPDSPRVRALRSDVDVARAEILAAGRWPNPRFTFDRESVAGTTENILTVAQPLPVTGRRGLEVQAATALVAAATSRGDELVRRARADLRLAFARLTAAQAREREIQRALERLRSVLQILERREAAGDIAGFDRLRAERELFDLEADEALSAIDRARAQGSLSAFFVGVDPASVVAVGAPVSPATLPPVAALIERAESTRGELVALGQERAAAALSATAADRRRFPEPEIVAGTKSSSIGDGDVGGVIAIQTSIPLFDRGKPERSAAEARERQAAARAEAFRASLRADIAALHAAVGRRRQAADRYRDTALRSVEQIERIARVSYEAGERGILELLDAYRTGVAAAARQATLDLEARQAEIELEFVTGWELP